jgi:hypothetical protein
MKIKIINKAEMDHNEIWPLKLSYLRQVVDHPDDYINHPANLDWGWLTTVLG